MNIFCTYCSASKDDNSKNLPAIVRYKSPRIHKVYLAASNLGVGFRILSGKYGLISPEEEIPYYDYLLSEEGSRTLSIVVSKQAEEAGLTGIVYFTRTLNEANLIPYHKALVLACRSLKIPSVVIELDDSRAYA